MSMSPNASMLLMEMERYERDAAKKSLDHPNKRDQDVYMEQSEIMSRYNKAVNERDKYLSDSKTFFVTEAIFRIYDEAAKKLDVQSPSAIRRNIVENFVREQGADNIVRRWRTASELLSETALIITKAINEAKKDAERDTFKFKLDNTISNDFYDALNKTDIDSISNAISTRVSAAIEDFTTKNMEEKMQIKETLDKANKMKAKHKNDSEEVKESFNAIAKRRISEIENRTDTSVFGLMVHEMAKNIIKSDDEEVKALYMEGAKLNMNNISDTCTTMYTFLETLNTAKMIPITEEFLKKAIFG